MKAPHMSMLNMARDLSSVPFIITSGSRCETYNKEVGGVEDSEHLTGQASDIYVPDSVYRFIILRSLLVAGCRRIGIGKDFIHAGTKQEGKAQKVLWLY